MQGLCDQGGLTVLSNGLAFTNFTLPYSSQCTPTRSIVSTDYFGTVPMNPPDFLMFGISLTFDVKDASGAIIGNQRAILSGQFDAAGNVSGTFDLHDSFTDSTGTHYECDTGLVTFTGKLKSG